jgi:hypothetical protein
MARTMLPVSGLRVQGETMRPFYRPKGKGMAYATSVRFLAGSLCHFAMSGRSAVTKSFTGWQTSIRSKISRIPDLNARHLASLITPAK